MIFMFFYCIFFVKLAIRVFDLFMCFLASLQLCQFLSSHD